LIEVRRATSQAEVAAALDLRERVFCGEQGVSLEADQDGLDPEALHVVALDGERIVGTCRLLFSQEGARLGRDGGRPWHARRASARRCSTRPSARRASGRPADDAARPRS